MSDREQVLADFQACTGLEDFNECLHLLNAHDWNLERAVNSVLNIINPVNSEDVEMEPVISVSDNVDQSKSVCFNVKCGDGINRIRINKDETIGTLKKLIEQRMGIPCNDQEIVEMSHLSERATVKDFTDRNAVSITVFRKQQRNKSNVNLQIEVRDGNSSKQLTLVVSKESTLRECKWRLESLCGIPVEQQDWTGVFGCQDCDVVGPYLKESNFVIVKRTQAYHNSTSTSSENGQHSSSNEELDRISNNSYTNNDYKGLLRRRAMIEADFQDETVAVESFIREFANRYGTSMPVVYFGTLENALRDSVGLPADERKLLAIYIHHDLSVSANVFCQQVLSSDEIISYLTANFIFWPWDFTLESNREYFLEKSTFLFGAASTKTLAAYKNDDFPVLIIIGRNRSTYEIQLIISGYSAASDVLMQLMNVHNMFEETRLRDLAEEQERSRRNKLLEEQDQAYQQSLLKDRIKETKRLEDIKQKESELKKLEAKTKQEQEIREHMKKYYEASLPEEPTADSNICKLRFRLPSGEFLTRNFKLDDPFNNVLMFVASKGFPSNEYKLLTLYPRVDISQIDTNQTISSAGLHPQDTLTLEHK